MQDGDRDSGRCQRYSTCPAADLDDDDSTG